VRVAEDQCVHDAHVVVDALQEGAVETHGGVALEDGLLLSRQGAVGHAQEFLVGAFVSHLSVVGDDFPLSLEGYSFVVVLGK
jgi:hypothetical protein